ncbi:bestrophin-2-like [Daphnia pulicaria]|uniref:bestrophin-2-like n=1 Tax=Daphnia pulicaria TaxID=35523 RepID=UPI001EEBA4CB|nr:bestrophin-2-like [Daphnia pulicaria]XP_046652815.1 bestrophin-2-like [Daphnia pulicaria]
MNLKKKPGLDLSGSFISLLWRWRGSLYKLCYKELICFLVPFGIVSVIYRQALNSEQKSLFEQVVRYCDRYLNMIPLSFILGFYVTIIATRWWQQCMALPWPDRLMLTIAMYIPGCDKESKLLRKTLMQNCNLMAVLVFRSISESVRTRLKSLEDVVNAGFMTYAEMETFKSVEADVNLYWLPGLWFSHRLREAQARGRIIDSYGTQLIMKELLEFRSKCGILWSYDWVSIPLVYTQVVTLSTYSFVIACIFGRQYTDNGSTDIAIDVYFPLWTVLQILFYMGLLKVAEHMINPYGEDDEDFDLSYLLNRHSEVINLGTNILTSDRCPPMEDENLRGAPGMHTPKNLDRTSLKHRFSQTLTGLYSTGKERKRSRAESITTISENVETNTVSSVDLKRLPDENEWPCEGVHMERI